MKKMLNKFPWIETIRVENKGDYTFVIVSGEGDEFIFKIEEGEVDAFEDYDSLKWEIERIFA